MHLDKNSYGTAALSILIMLAIVGPLLYFVGPKIYICIICGLVIGFTTFTVWFHRVPVRNKVGSDRVISSVADGKVVIVEKTYEKEYLKKECMQVSIYMNFFDVHANFWPMSGEVSYYKYHPGKYLLAFLPKASELNEHSSSAIRNGHGEIFFKQIAGTFARRIVCYSEVGKKTVAGEQCGIIKFGSRIDMYLPLDADIKVKIGDVTRACETVIAELK